LARLDNPDGTIAHAELSDGPSVLMLSSDRDARDLEGNHWHFGTTIRTSERRRARRVSRRARQEACLS
jgi:uncharacterized glyoxalase superfamily protein PhnB